MTNYQGGASRASLKCSENERRNNDEKTTKIFGKKREKKNPLFGDFWRAGGGQPWGDGWYALARSGCGW